MDAFWGADLPHSRTTVPDDGGSSVVHHGGRYKSRSDNVSYEDLLEFSEERQQYFIVKAAKFPSGKHQVTSVGT